MKHIVKRRGHTEVFDDRKLYASVYSSCLAVRVPSAEAELVADRVASDVKKWLEEKHEVTSNDILIQAHRSLQLLNPDAAYIYKTHREFS